MAWRLWKRGWRIQRSQRQNADPYTYSALCLAVGYALSTPNDGAPWYNTVTGHSAGKRRCRWPGWQSRATMAAEAIWRGCCNDAARAGSAPPLTNACWECDNLIN